MARKRTKPEVTYKDIRLKFCTEYQYSLFTKNRCLFFIGINKKLIDRDMTNYFCIHCLSELLETTESELYDKIHECKEEGCTLFS